MADTHGGRNCRQRRNPLACPQHLTSLADSDHLRCGGRVDTRLAAFARAEPRRFSGGSTGEEASIPSQWDRRRAARPAIDTRRGNGIDEEAVRRRVATGDRRPAFALVQHNRRLHRTYTNPQDRLGQAQDISAYCFFTRVVPWLWPRHGVPERDNALRLSHDQAAPVATLRRIVSSADPTASERGSSG